LLYSSITIIIISISFVLKVPTWIQGLFRQGVGKTPHPTLNKPIHSWPLFYSPIYQVFTALPLCCWHSKHFNTSWDRHANLSPYRMTMVPRTVLPRYRYLNTLPISPTSALIIANFIFNHFGTPLRALVTGTLINRSLSVNGNCRVLMDSPIRLQF